MGSILQHSRHLSINLLKQNTDVAASVSNFQHTRIDFKCRPMDRSFEKNNRECARNTILRQEQVFKQQVNELHRVYQAQKSLTAELRAKEDARSRYWSSTSTSETSHSSHINYSQHQNTFGEEFPLKNKGFDLEQPVEEAAWADEDCDVELRLSVGCGIRKKNSRRT